METLSHITRRNTS